MNKIKIFALSSLALFSAMFGMTANAAADPDVLTAAETVASTTAENIKGVITANVGTLVVVGALILSIFVIWRFGKRLVSGR